MLSALLALATSSRSLPPPPLQFSARIVTTAHQLNATDDYPPRTRQLTVYYDFPARRSRVDYDGVAPHEPPKAFVRRYDLQFEWSVLELGGEKACHKSRLREAMPMPRWPEAMRLVGDEMARGRRCERWREDHGEEVVELLVERDGGAPVRLTTHIVDFSSPDGERSPLLSYEVLDFEPAAPPEEAFRMLASSTSPVFEGAGALRVEQCERVAQEMGFPYIHFLHSYYYT
mmetsp:Transcript_19213/g.61307  ORF Transcript_19213/g.61307 Transcript_19213/m.61307 type:complete len:230 (+) Transcript_19213:65-754(+)